MLRHNIHKSTEFFHFYVLSGTGLLDELFEMTFDCESGFSEFFSETGFRELEFFCRQVKCSCMNLGLSIFHSEFQRESPLE